MKHSDPFAESIKKTLDQQTVDDDSRRKLSQARHRALEAVEMPKSAFYRPTLLAFASIAIIVLTVRLAFGPEHPEIAVDNIEAFEIITSQESLDLYEELEFYDWLDGQFSDEG